MTGDWADHAIWWHVYPLGFLGAEPEALPPGSPAVHRLPRLATWLDYLVDLGCNGLALGPVFASSSHGYDTVDHFVVDARLGNEDDLLALVEQARTRGVHVLLDGVFNHVGRDFTRLVDVEEHGAGSAYAPWFAREPDGALRTFEGHDALVALDHGEPAVADYVGDVMTYWLDRGISGWRLDAAYAVPIPFWRTVSERIRAEHADAWLVGEVIHGDYAPYVTEGGLDAVTQYELWKAVWSSLNDANFFELAWALERHDELLGTCAPQTFLGNHDVTRLASRLQDARHLDHALVVLCTVGGVPTVYAGDEQGFTGVKEERFGGDDAVRPVFPDDPAGLAADGWVHYRRHQELLGLRRRHAWLVSARTTPVEVRNAGLGYVAAPASATTGPDRLFVALSVADEPTTMAAPEGRWQVLAGAGDLTSGRVTLPPHGWLVSGAG